MYVRVYMPERHPAQGTPVSGLINFYQFVLPIFAREILSACKYSYVDHFSAPISLSRSSLRERTFVRDSVTHTYACSERNFLGKKQQFQ